MSHDIRTPLSAITGYAKLLASDYDTPPEEVRREAGHVLEQAAAIGRLISDLRFAFEVDVNSVATRIEPTDVVSVVHRALAALRLDSRFSRAQVVVRRSRRVPLAKADPALLARALTNVLVNAAVHNDPGVDIEVALESGDGTVDIVVSDQGSGMDEEALARLFERRFSGATARGDRGMGLGLPIARRLVEEMQGTIEVESEIGRGTRVTVRLPRQAETTRAGTQPAP